MSDGGSMNITCPRCGSASEERFYGPCETCRSALRATMRGEAKAVDVGRFDPKMNVVPNQVALKE